MFWVDNFDVKVERQSGKNSIHTAHLVAFQEPDEFSKINQESVTIEITKDRKIQTVHTEETTIQSINPKQNPLKIEIEHNEDKDSSLDLFLLKYVL